MQPPRSSEDELILGLVSVSDRASQGIYDDEGIPSLESWCRKAMTNPLKIHKRLIPDDQFTIEKTLRELVDIIGCDLILTTGGTGPARRDLTPEATLAVATREMPGFGEQMRAISGHFVPTAILSRQVAVLRETPDHAALIINLPGRPKAIAETLEGLKDENGKVLVNGIFAAVPYCIDLIGGPYIEKHEEVIKAFRPKNAVHPKKDAAKDAKSAEAPKVAPAPKAEPAPEPKAQAVKAEAPAAQKAATPTVEILNPYTADVEPFAAKDILITRARQVSGPYPEMTLVWLHGMGVNNADFAGFADEIREFGGPDCQMVLPNAPLRFLEKFRESGPLRAWFDLKGTQIDDKEDEAGIRQSAQRVLRLIEDLEKEGVPREQIFLGGFSQGAAVSLYTGLRLTKPLGGVIAFSGYVPVAHKVSTEITSAGRATPIFMAHGEFDPVINPLIAERGAQVIREVHPKFTFGTYKMEHNLDALEMHDLAAFLKANRH